MGNISKKRFWALFPTRGEGAFYRSLSQWITERELAKAFSVMPPFFPLAQAAETCTFAHVQLLRTVLKTVPFVADSVTEFSFEQSEIQFVTCTGKSDIVLSSLRLQNKIPELDSFFRPIDGPLPNGFIFGISLPSHRPRESQDPAISRILLQTESPFKVNKFDIGIMEFETIDAVGYSQFNWRQFFNTKLSPSKPVPLSTTDWIS